MINNLGAEKMLKRTHKITPILIYYNVYIAISSSANIVKIPLT